MTPHPHPQPSIYATTITDDFIDHTDIEDMALRPGWTLDAANARVTNAMRDAGWFERDGVMVPPTKPGRARKAVAR